MTTKQPKSTKPRRELANESVPLFPELKASEVKGLRIEAVLDDDETFAFDGMSPTETTVADLRRIFADEIACDEIDHMRKTPGRLELQITAVGVRGKKREPYDITNRDLLLTANGDGEPPILRVDGSVEGVGVPVSVEQASSIDEPIIAELRPPPRTGPRTKRTPREHVVAPRDSSILPGDVSGERALDHITNHSLQQHIQSTAQEGNKAVADGARMLVSAVSDGIRHVFKHAENRDERISELKTQIAELKQQRAEDRAEYLRRNNDLEDDLANSKRTHRREVAKLEEQIDDLKEELKEAEAKAVKITADVKSMAWGLAQQFGPAVVQGLLDKVGVKMPDAAAAAAANGASS